MANKEYNDDFYSYDGVINRKNYCINMLILIAIYTGLSFIKLENFAQFIPIKFIYTMLVFAIDISKFIIVVASLSIVYRRIMDFSKNRGNSFNQIMKKLFVLLFVFPFFYLFCIRYFIDIIPILKNILDLITIFILCPLTALCSIILAFVKGNQ